MTGKSNCLQRLEPGLLRPSSPTVAANRTTVVAFVHDMGLASSNADHIVLMSQGQITASGIPRHVLTDALLSDVFDCEVKVSVPPQPDVPYILPRLCRLNRKNEHGMNAKT